MAKRKRLSPAQAGFLAPEGPLETKSAFPAPPIAQVAGDAATASALSELTDMVETARAEGRLIQALPLGDVDAGYLVRDRLASDAEELESLEQSLKARGQQTAIEVVDLGPDHPGPRYGLISGWRRLTALQRLYYATGNDRFASVLARITAPQGADAAYVAMVEENEIRVGLSYYERARITVKAVEAGVFAHHKEALQSLFAAASRAKRSKINSFIRVVDGLDMALKFPTAIPERLGLELSRRMAEDRAVAPHIQVALKRTRPETAEEELKTLEQALKSTLGSNSVTASPTPTKPEHRRTETAPGVFLEPQKGGARLVISGPGVDADLLADLDTWLRGRA